MLKKPIMKTVAEAPAITLERGIEAAERIEKTIVNKKPFKLAEEYWNTLGPGLTTGAADDDPSGIATYSQAGAQFGNQLLWTAPLSFPLMATIQEMCARIGLVTGRGLAANIRLHSHRWVLYGSTTLLFAANTFNIGADLGMMAKTIQLILPKAPFSVLILLIALISLFLQIFTTYARYAKYLKYLAFMLLAYIASAFVVDIDWKSVLRSGFIPTIAFSKEQLFLICGILGTTISPYLFFWQTAQEVEEEILAGRTTVAMRRGATKKEIGNMRVDIWSGMFLSNLVMFFIIAVSAATLWANGVRSISSAADAAAALRPLMGSSAYFLFTIGIIGTGLLAIPVLAGSASYALSESFRWKHGLYRTLKQAHAFYGIIIISMGIGLLLNFASVDPIKALIYSAVANGIISPFILIPIVTISSNHTVMGKWANSSSARIAGWIIIGIMTLSAVGAIVSLVF